MGKRDFWSLFEAGEDHQISAPLRLRDVVILILLALVLLGLSLVMSGASHG